MLVQQPFLKDNPHALPAGHESLACLSSAEPRQVSHTDWADKVALATSDFQRVTCKIRNMSNLFPVTKQSFERELCPCLA